MLTQLRRVAGVLAAMAHTRIELASTELAEAMERAMVSVLLAFVGLLLILASVLSMSMLIVLVVDETQRVATLAGIGLLLLGTGVSVLYYVRRRIQTSPALLAATLDELRHDVLAMGRDS